MAPYQLFKLNLVDFFGISKDGFHIILGFLIFLIFASVFKIKLSSWKTSVAPIVLALILEVLDFKDAMAFNGPVDYIDSFRDIVVTVILPIISVFFFRIRKYEL